jgi:signal recognition particle subunit SRP54
MGPIANLLGMLPGAGAMKEQIKNIDDRDLDRTAAIIRSMTPEERVNSKIINASRRVRIANGSGVSVTDVNQLLERFTQAQKMMSQMAGSMGLPGMGPMSKKARGRQMQAQSKKGKKGKGRPKAAPARRPVPGVQPGAGLPGLPAGFDPSQGLPDLTKLNFDQFKDDRPGR